MTHDRVGIREDVARTLEWILRSEPAITSEIGPQRLRSRLARHWFRLARTYRRRGAISEARQAAGRAAELRPLNLRYQLLRRWQLA